MSSKAAFFVEDASRPFSEVFAQQAMVAQRIWDYGFRYINRVSWDEVDPSGSEVIFLPGHAAGAIEENDLHTLQDWVARGGTLILETPPAPVDDLFEELMGIDSAARRRTIIPKREGPLELRSLWLRICGPHPLLRGYDRSLPLNPVWGEVAVAEPSASAEVLAELVDLDGTTPIGPGLVLNRYGKGRVLSYLFTLGYALRCGLQGRGGEHLSIYESRPGAGTASFWEPQGKTEVVRAVDQLLVGPPTWEHPFADFLLLPVVNVLLDHFPELPVVYWIPQGKEAAVIHTADGDGATDADLLAYLEEMESRGLRTSLFLLADQEHDARRYASWQAKADLGLHFSPAQWSIPQQVELMRKQGFSPRSARGHSLQWSGLATTARALAEQGVAFDSTLSIVISSFGGRHYFSTGTALPYRLFDVSGEMVNVLEIPLPFMEFFFDEFASDAENTSTVERERVSDYYQALTKHHAVFSVVFHAVHTRKTERWLRFERGLAHLLNQSGFYHTNMTGYGDWFVLRDQVKVRCGPRAGQIALETPDVPGLSLLSTSRWTSDAVRLKPASAINLWGRSFQNVVADFTQGKHTLRRET